MKAVYLCGFMGCGKSTIGQRLSKKMGVAFLDTDKEIVRQTGKEIAEIFAEKTEQGFRQLEHALMQQWSVVQNKIIATGGGTFLNPENVVLAKQNGLIVFLETSFSICYERIYRDQTRPIVNQSSKEALKQLFEQRQPLYQQTANLIINANQSVELCAQEIKTLLSPFL